MRKFSKIIESKEELLSRISSNEDEIEEIFADLLDMGYYHMIDPVYISTKTGYPHRRKKESQEYFPGLEIDVKRSMDKDEKSDVRNWNGGVYYEGDLSIMEAIYNSIYRIQSMFKDNASVYYSIRSVNEIEIRVIFDKEKSGTPIDYEIVEDVIKELEIFKNDIQNERTVNWYGMKVDGHYIDYNQTWRRPGGDVYECKIALAVDSNGTPWNHDVLKSSVDKGETSNRRYLYRLFSHWCSIFKDRVDAKNELELRVKKKGFVIKSGDIDVVDIEYWFEEQSTKKIVIERGGFLKKDKFVEYKVHDLYFRVKIIELDK